MWVLWLFISLYPGGVERVVSVSEFPTQPACEEMRVLIEENFDTTYANEPKTWRFICLPR